MGNIAILKPGRGDGNQYIDIIRSCIEAAGYKVITPRMSLMPEYWFLPISVSNFNWYENVDSDSAFCTYWTMIKRKAMFYYLGKVKRSKMIVTVHNRKDHFSKGIFSERMLGWLIKNADCVLILSSLSKEYVIDLGKKYGCDEVEKKIVRICHPSYSSAYKHSLEDEFYNIRGEKREDIFELLYFGTISEYKNVEILDRLAPLIQDKKIHITVAGGGNPDYVTKLKEKFLTHKNISFYDKYIPDESIWGVIKGADCVLLPYHKESVLNSGAVMLALSVGRNVICPRNGTTDEFPQELIYSYEYEKESDHIKKLYDKVIEAYTDYMDRREYYFARMNDLETIANDKYSYENTKLAYKKLYDDLTKNGF